MDGAGAGAVVMLEVLHSCKFSVREGGALKYNHRCDNIKWMNLGNTFVKMGTSAMESCYPQVSSQGSGPTLIPLQAP